MPWCEPCARYLTPSAMTAEGRCPDCGERIDVANVHGTVTAETLDLRSLAGKESERVPWHFKLLVGLLCLYLGWRVVQLFGAVF